MTGGRPAPRFRTIQVCPKSAARKHAQALALSNAHISPYWQQRAFSGSVKTGPALNGATCSLGNFPQCLTGRNHARPRR